MIFTTTVRMTEGQFDNENKHTEMFFKAKEDHLNASQMKNPTHDPCAEFNLMTLVQDAPTVTSEDHANKNGFFCMTSHKDDDSYIEYISPLRTVKLDTTRTELTGVAVLTVTVNHQEQA